MRTAAQIPLFGGAVLMLVLSGGCGGVPSAHQTPKDAPTYSERCNADRPTMRPFIVEWPATDRASLESQARQGLVVVHYQGCDFEVLKRCRAPGSYRYVALTPKQEHVAIRNEDDLYASIPVYAVKFEGKLAQAGQLNVATTIVGMYEPQASGSIAEALEGDCDGATHVVTSLAVGAFEFFSGTESAAGASVDSVAGGAGARSSSTQEMLSRDGQQQSCSASKRDDAMPPDGCGALIRLEVAPLSANLGAAKAAKEQPAQPASAASPAIVKASVLAGEDEGFTDTTGGAEWGNRCYKHLRARRLDNAHAACSMGLAQQPSAEVKGAILYNLALIEELRGDVKAACARVRESLDVRPNNSAVIKKFDTLGCGGL